jgi:predicted phage tail protein
MRFLSGFSFATVVPGVLLVFAWCAAAAVAALGGPDINFPDKLASSGANMLVIGGVIYILLKSPQTPKADNRSESA